MVIGWLLCIALLVVGFLCLTIAFKKDDDAAGTGIMGSAFLFIGLLVLTGLTGLFADKNPTTMDVYRGKTTLKITYVDSVAVDSAVVWKPEFEPKKKK
jgi:hypothetical protein